MNLMPDIATVTPLLAAGKFTIELVVYASLAITPLLFLLMPVRKALVTAYCVLWMFLPIAKINLPALPDLNKSAVIGAGVLIALVLFYIDHLLKRYRPSLFDIPVVIFGFIAPFASSMANDLGFEIAMNEAIIAMFLWVVPYFAGRIILGDELGVETLALGLFFAALIYTPFAWFEMLMSPQLHLKFYGYHQHEFIQTKRGWSYRPMVFMNHGLMTSMWLAAGSICGVWLLVHKRLRWPKPRIAAYLGPPKYAVAFLVFTTTVSNSVGAVLLMLVGFGALYGARKFGPAWVLAPLIAASPIYILTRATGTVQTDDLVSLVEPISDARAASLGFRLHSEDAYVVRALEQPVVGFGGTSAYRPRDEETGKRLVADGLWIITLGKTGMIGLISMMLTLLAVPVVVVYRQGRGVWQNPRFAATGALTVLVCIYMIDNLLNAMVNPIYMLALGALASFATVPLGQKLRQRRPARVPGQPGVQPAQGRPPRSPLSHSPHA